MAKKKNANDKLHDADLKHYMDVEKYVKKVDELYQKAIMELSALAAKVEGIPLDKSFSFSANPAIAKEVEGVISKLAGRITAEIETGARKEWNAACVKSNEYLETVLKTSKLTKTTLQRYQDRNLEALAAFQVRKVNGLDLSERVWKHVAPLKDEVEAVADTTKKYYKHGINSSKSLTKIERALGTGMSAAELSREVRSCLKEPNKLFRRVRDKYGNLHLSKNAKLYHPGQGVYRSSYKNAMRMTRTEINMAYKQSDHMRWQQLDFVVGIEIHKSNNHPEVDTCDCLAGKYPKDFKFVGWHPQCRCYATPILKKYDEFDKDRENIGNPEYKQQPSSEEVNDVPKGFNDYVKDNHEQMKGWKSTPYYLKDNPQYVDKALHPEKYAVKALVLDPEIQKRLSDFEMYGFNHQGSKKFNDALERAKEAVLKGRQEAFDEAMAEMEAIRKKNEASTASKAAKKKVKQYTEEDAKKKMIDDDLATFSDGQKKNIKELEAAIKQKKGLRMSYEEANTGKENQNYKEQYLPDPKGSYYDKKGNRYSLNPDWKDSDKGYSVNCQTCTLIHELRRRGFNVEAVDNYRKKVWKVYELQGVGYKHQGYRVGKWLDEDGKPVGPTYTHEWAAKKGIHISDKRQVEQFFEEYSKGKDGRFEIYVDWKGGSAHVFCAERVNGKWKFFDPQSAEMDVFDGYAAKAKLHTFGIIRTDDKLINPKLASTFIPKGELPIVVKQKTRADEIREIAQKRHDARTAEKVKELRDYAAKHKQMTDDAYKELNDILADAKGIKEADVKALSDMLSGKDGVKMKSSDKVVKFSIEKMRKEAEKMKPIIKEYNDAMDDAEAIIKELKGIKDIDMDAVKKAIGNKSIKQIKAETKKLQDVKKEIESLTNIDNPMQVAKDFSLADAKAVNKSIGETIDKWLNKYGYKSMDDNLEHAKAKLEQEISLAGNNSSKYKTWKVAQDSYKKMLSDVETKIAWNEVGTKFFTLSSAKLQTPGFTSRIAKLGDAISAKDLSKAHKIISDLEKEKAELDAIAKQMSDFGTYAATQKQNSKFGKLYAETQQALAADDYAKVKALLPQMADVKKTNEASVISHAKTKKFWQDAKAKLNEVKKNARPEDKDAVDALEKAIADKDKKAAEEALKKFKTSGNTTKQMSEVSDSDVSKAGGRVEYTMQQLGVDRQTAQDYNDAVIGFSYQWDWEIRQVQMGNLTFTSRHGHSLADIQKKADDIEKYIDAAPKWNGGKTHRGVSVTKSQIQTWEGYINDGTEIDMKGTASWSTSRHVSEGFSGMHTGEKDANGEVMTEKALFVCEDPQYGTSIRHLSRFSGEREILCSSRCRWIITEHKFENGIHVFKVRPV